MCVIINKPVSISIPDDILKKCWDTNPHGAGFMYSDSSKLIVKKGFMTFDRFLKEYRAVDQSKNIVIHFRLASYGEVVPEQTHPMSVYSNLAFVHNGHMITKYIVEGTNTDKSDTMVFNEKVLMKLPINFLAFEAIRELINSYIENSIILFMNNEGKITILGDQGDTLVHRGCWFSNDYWLDSRYDQVEYCDNK